jgi:hypothetical protein
MRASDEDMLMVFATKCIVYERQNSALKQLQLLRRSKVKKTTPDSN